MRDIYVVTHPEATHHLEGRVGGWFDSELTPRGHEHAGLAAQALRSRIEVGSPVTVFTSDLRRTVQTAEPIGAALGVAPIRLHGLREKSYGEGGGMPDAWFRERFVPPPAEGERLEHDEGIAGAETKGAWVRRVYAAMDEVVADPSPTAVVVTHGGSVSFVIAHWIGMPLDALSRVAFRVPSGSITHLQRDDYFHNHAVVSLGDTAHLKDR